MEMSHNFNLNTLPPSGIHSSTQLAQMKVYKYPHSSLGKLCWFNAGVEEFPPIVRLNSLSENPHLPVKIHGYSKESS